MSSFDKDAFIESVAKAVASRHARNNFKTTRVTMMEDLKSMTSISTRLGRDITEEENQLFRKVYSEESDRFIERKIASLKVHRSSP